MKNTPEVSVDAPAALEQLVHHAEQAGASDIHLQMDGTRAQVWFRLDGLLTPVESLPETLAERVFGRIKFLARLKTYQESLPQDGRIDRADLHSQNDLRVATYPTVTGEKIVLRLFVTSEARRLDELEYPADTVSALRSALRQNSGLILLTGPAGSGKTTTIYACLRELAEHGGRHIITVEDPVERIISGVMQTEVNEARGLNFATAARHLLRQDPQVLVLGEIRDDETAQLAIRAALTGHQVISTLHAGSCKGVFERLLVMCPDRYGAVSSVILVLNQRLIRRLCQKCGGSRCADCLDTGYRGRIPVAEWVAVTETVRSDLRTSGPDSIKPVRSMAEAVSVLRDQGLTNDEEIVRVTGSR
ncbi:MAG: Flp pilus assembly complex ATPase component TadA [Opitutaceae bacterium]|nr:Flp pilus assembly complex ATPase component TadA [Verrucomicrobiales bacterium]